MDLLLIYYIVGCRHHRDHHHQHFNFDCNIKNEKSFVWKLSHPTNDFVNQIIIITIIIVKLTIVINTACTLVLSLPLQKRITFLFSVLLSDGNSKRNIFVLIDFYFLL